MRMLLALLTCVLANAEIVDRIAVSVGNQVLTEGQILEELRVTAFLNQQEVELTPAQKRAAADRMIEQLLLKRDLDFSHYPAQPSAGVDKLEEEIRARYPNEEAFAHELARYGVTEGVLRQHLVWQITMLRYIEYRFQPSVQVSDGEIRQYFDKKHEEWQDKGLEKAPTFEESRGEIEKVLIQQHVDQAVDRWLGDARTQVEIVYRKEAFQ